MTWYSETWTGEKPLQRWCCFQFLFMKYKILQRCQTEWNQLIAIPFYNVCTCLCNQNAIIIMVWVKFTVHHKKSAHGSHFIVFCCDLLLIISFRFTKPAQGQSRDCPWVSAAPLSNIGKLITSTTFNDTSITKQTQQHNVYNIWIILWDCNVWWH